MNRHGFSMNAGEISENKTHDHPISTQWRDSEEKGQKVMSETKNFLNGGDLTEATSDHNGNSSSCDVGSSPTLPNEKKDNQESVVPFHFESVLKELGNPGKYVVFQIFLVLPYIYCISSTLLNYVFIGYEPPHTCMAVANESELLSQYGLSNSTGEIWYEKCAIQLVSNVSGQDQTVATLDCVNGHDYRDQRHISFVAEWDLVCENARLKELVQTVLLVGQLVGAVFFTSLADKVGRKSVFVTCNFLVGFINVGIAYAPNIYVMIALRFLVGMAVQGTGIVAYTYCLEWVMSAHRRYICSVCGLNWSFSLVILALTAYLMRDSSWRSFQLVTALFASNAIPCAFLLMESPRWLVDNKRHGQVLKIIQKAAKLNGKDAEKIKDFYTTHIAQSNGFNSKSDGICRPEVSQANAERYSALDLLRHKVLFLSTLAIWFVWITNASTYYGLILTSSSLAGDRHLNFFLMNLVEIPAELTNLFALAYFGRKRIITVSVTITGCTLLTATLLMALGKNLKTYRAFPADNVKNCVDVLESDSTTTDTLATGFSVFGKYCITACFNALFLYTPELFPTNLRSAGLGVCSGASTLGGMIAPYSQALTDLVLWGPGTLFSVMCFVSGLIFSRLPETRDRPMPTTLIEMKQRIKNKSPVVTVSHFDTEMVEITIPKEATSINTEQKQLQS